MEIYIGENVLSAICAQIMLSAQGAELKEFADRMSKEAMASMESAVALKQRN